MPRLGVVWFRLDLRTADHPALVRACHECDVILPVFLMHEHRMRHPRTAPLRAQFLLESLAALDRNLRQRRGQLILRRIAPPADGTPPQRHYEDAVLDFLDGVHAAAVYTTPQVEPGFRAQDQRLADACRQRGIDWIAEESVTALPLAQLVAPSGDPYRVYTPFWKHFAAVWHSTAPTPLAPPMLSAASAAYLAELPTDAIPSLTDLGIDPASARTRLTGGEGEGRRQLSAFLAGPAAGYAEGRDFLDRDATSHLSPYLHAGAISPREIIWRALQAQQEPGSPAGDLEKFIKEVVWREFAHAILWYFPATVREAFQAKYRDFPWHIDPQAAHCWRTGQTGFPVIDAAMRELTATGGMHNRARMLVASFLTKDLGLSWKSGADWFLATLLDGNLASNTLGWQWTAGIGVDAAPYFRIFNPVTQSQKFDPAGTYIRRWVPELAHLDTALLHDPARHPAGLDYPAPIIDRAAVRDTILARYRQAGP